MTYIQRTHEAGVTAPEYVRSITGPELKALRRAAGISQAEMGRRVGIGRRSVSRWETKRKPLDLTWPSATRMLRVLGMSPWSIPLSVLLPVWEKNPLLALANPKVALVLEDRRRARRCDAKTRTGQPCKNRPERGRRRCKFHGGKSTGPKTAEGRERIAEAQRRRWRNNRGGAGLD